MRIKDGPAAAALATQFPNPERAGCSNQSIRVAPPSRSQQCNLSEADMIPTEVGIRAEGALEEDVLWIVCRVERGRPGADMVCLALQEIQTGNLCVLPHLNHRESHKSAGAVDGS